MVAGLPDCRGIAAARAGLVLGSIEVVTRNEFADLTQANFLEEPVAISGRHDEIGVAEGSVD